MLLREALLNVVNNAAEACAAAGRVAVAARAVRSAGVAVVEIEVADDGPGIARADLARVFVPGFTTKESGSGVGLAIAEQVMAAHHGRILLDSEVGRGTRVTLVLPADLGGFAGLATLVGERSGGGGTE
jgi:signal transduction histidine kinase